MFGLQGFLGTATDLGADIATNGAYGNQQAMLATNAANVAIAKDNRDFQERMSDTAYQRQADDLQKAGLNRILAAGAGGASTPSGAMATLQAPRPGDIGAGLAKTAETVLSTAKDQAVARSQIDTQDRQQELMDAQRQAAASQARANVSAAVKSEQENEIRYQQQESEIAAKKAQNKAAEVNANWSKEHSGISNWMKVIQPGASSAAALGTLLP